ncbi:MAG TPA: hypothetical protein VKV95_19360 [Terriglobia bacterium]|nr:hypothetical protein [Terriglobia bacterium]
MRSRIVHVILGFGLFVSLSTLGQPQKGQFSPIIPPPGSPFLSVSAVPPTGDANPYGVAFVPNGFPVGGPLHANDILTSNFNSNSGLQGTGTTIMQIKQSWEPASVFFQGQSGLGLTTALGVLRSGFVIVGNVPTTDGTCATVQQGSLLIIDRQGNLAMTLSNSLFLNGPWDLTIHEEGNEAQVFVSNVLSGTVTRINLMADRNGKITVQSMVQIASGYGTACSAAAVVVGPTGLAYDGRRDILYVASTDDNEIFAVSNAARTSEDHGPGQLIYQDDQHLHGPLALALAPNGDLITANGDAINEDLSQLSEIVEFTPEGQFVSQFQIDAVAGSAFGLAITQSRGKTLFAAVDDNTSVIEEWIE